MKLNHLLLALAALVGLTSCLKEKAPLGPDNSVNVLEIHQRIPDHIASPTTSTYPLFVETFELAPESDFDVVIRYAGAGTAPQDITVNVELKPDAVDVYNTENGDHLTLLPDALYAVDNWTVVIPKGQKEAILKIRLKTDQFDFAEAYALPLTIKSASHGTVSGNFGTVIYQVGAKNQWDGEYDNFYETINLAGNGKNTVKLNTVNATRVKLSPGLIGVYSNEVWFEIDPATNKVTVIMTSLAPIATDPSSHYDPATKTFHILYTTNGGGRTIKQTMIRK